MSFELKDDKIKKKETLDKKNQKRLEFCVSKKWDKLEKRKVR